MAAAMRSSHSAPQTASGRRRHHSDPLEGSPSLPPPPKRAKGRKAPSDASSLASSKQERRRHKAIEKAFLKAQAQAQVPPTDSSAGLGPPSTSDNLASGVPRSIRELSPDISISASMAPASDSQLMFQTLPEEASVVAEQHAAEDQVSPSPSPQAHPPPSLALSLEDIITRAIQQGFASCMQQTSVPNSASRPTQNQPRDTDDSLSEQDRFESHSSADQASVSEVEDFQDQALSDDEGLTPDQPSFIGLFRPQVFRSLLFKAIATTHLGEVSPATPTTAPSDPAAAMFAEPTVDPETIPAPKLFMDVIQRQWSLPGSGPSPNSLDKRLYNSAAPLASLLQPPVVDPPVVALTNVSHPTGPSEDSLRPEDKRAEKTLLKGHMATAWSIKASTSASFFNRAALLWLKQLQSRIPASDARSHQDLNKISAALEYSADATLNATRFSARSLGSTITSRRLLWLRSWQADMRSKWQLASAPYSGGSLFGPCLEPLLVETRDRRKILPPASRRGDARFSAPTRYQSFRASESASFQHRFQRSYPPKPQQDYQVRQGARYPP